MTERRETANGKTTWYAIEQRYRGLGGRWEMVPGWYTLSEAREIRAVLRRSGYAARVVRCEVVS
jgi:hypothetical protein